MQQNLTLEQRTVRPAGVPSLVVALESCVVFADPHCPCRGGSSAEPGMHSDLLGGLKGDHSPESWAGGGGCDSPHKKDGSYKPEAVLEQSL